MPHRMGSKLIIDIIYELINKSRNLTRKPPFCMKDLIVLLFVVKGGKGSNPPNMITIFFETRKKGNELFFKKNQF